MVATLGNFATKLLTGSRVGITRVRGTPQVRRDRRADGVPDAAAPPGGGAAHALARRHPARGLRQAARADRGPPARGRRSARRGRARPRRRLGARRGAPPTSSTCSAVDDASAAPVPAETEAIGARLAAGLAARRLVLVSGELGAGKTTLIRGACRELGVTEPVVSPTFTIGRRYRGRVPVSHLDLYRLDEPGGRGPGPARRLPDARRGRLRRVAGGGRAAARRTANRPARRAPPRRAATRVR